MTFPLADTMMVLMDEQLETVIRQALDAGVLEVRQLSGSVTNQSYRVRTTTATVVVKRTTLRDWTNETHALNALVTVQDVPTASLLAAGLQPHLPWLVLQWIEGAPTSSDDVRHQAGQAVHALHDQVAPHFGPPAAPADTWREVLLRELDDEVNAIRSAGLLTAPELSSITTAVNALPEYQGPPRWLHGDLKDVHLHTKDQQLKALLDWGDASAGDPVYDLARYSLEGDGPLRALLAGYGHIMLTDQAMRGYRLRFTLGCLATEVREDGDWFDTYLRRIHADL